MASYEMLDQNNLGAEWANQTTMHPIGIALVVICGFAVLILPRRHVIWPFAITACFISSAQRIVVLGLDFDVLRIMVLFGFVRFFIKKEYRNFYWTPLDKGMVYFLLAKILIHTLQLGVMGIFVQELGKAFSVGGGYFVFRNLIRTWKDIENVVVVFMVISIPVCIFFVVENLTAYNVFSIFGGVPEFTLERDGRLRCQGAFSHPIAAGCFWASLLPLMVALRWASAGKKFFVHMAIGFVAIIILTTASSTPVFGVLSGIVGGVMFFLRKQMKLVRRFTVATLLGLHIVMQAPVWHLISRISAVSGSTGYFRYALIDAFIKNIGEWWLLGTQSTGHWIWGILDIPNQYVLEGVQGGLLSLILFVAIIVKAFSSIGRAWRLVQQDKAKLAIIWAGGVALFVHCANFIGLAYFGQIIMIWSLQLALIASMDVFTKQSVTRVDF